MILTSVALWYLIHYASRFLSHSAERVVILLSCLLALSGWQNAEMNKCGRVAWKQLNLYCEDLIVLLFPCGHSHLMVYVS